MLAALLVTAISPPSYAQQGRLPATSPGGEPGSQFNVYLVTMGPGPLVYERFGHNAILIEDTASGTQAAYNYGIFDFGEGDLLSTVQFIFRFVQGRLLYRVEAWRSSPMIDFYVESDRSVWIQELNLTPPQRQALAAFLANNVRPENSQYLYDYYRNNCSTKVRDALDAALNGQIKRQLETIPVGTTYRRESLRHTSYNIPICVALNYIQGHPVDQSLNAWEESFLPLQLQAYLRQVMVTDAQGQQAPLVRREQTIYLSRSLPAAPSSPPRWLGWHLAAGILLGGLLVLLAWQAPRHWGVRLAFAAVSAAWLLVAGLAGFIGSALWLLSDHLVVRHNENLLQLSLVALPLVVFVPALAYRKSWARRTALYLALALVAFSALGLLAKVLPWFYQPNASIIAFALPAHLGLLAAVYLLIRAPETMPAVARPRPATQSLRGGRNPHQ